MPLTARLLHDPPLVSLEEYMALGGGNGLAGARHLGPAATIAEISDAGLRGRGGAGFPTGSKWRSIASGGPGTRYAVCNAAEGEPGTFKDRALLRSNPYAVLEGLLIAAETVGATEAYLAMKASFLPEMESVRRALVEIEAADWLGGVTVTLVTGPEEYLFGEEKALLEVIEGKEPLPRWLPPYLHGLFATGPQLGWQSSAGPDVGELPQDGAPDANPTLINNAETFAQAAWIMANGVDEFRSLGTEASPGTVICTIVGDVDAPGVVEVAMGTPLSDVIEACGGPRGGHRVKAVFPGVANAVLGESALATPLTYEHLEAVGSGLGAAGFIVYDDSACMVEVARTLSRFLSVESCGQCPPCKLGTAAITAALDRIRSGSGTDADLGTIEERLRLVTDGNRCYLPVQEQVLISSILRTFPEDVAAHLDGWCPSDGREIATPKLVELTGGVATYDRRQDRKRPDWTYAD
jgi:NADH-quinone oxidoreductase subunit F